MTLDLLGRPSSLLTCFCLQESHRPEWAHASQLLRMPFYHNLTPYTTVACASADKAADNAAGGRWEYAVGCHRPEGRENTASVHSLPWTEESSAIKSAAVLFLLWLLAFRQQHIYWLFIGCEHSEQWLCGQGPGVQLSVAHGSAEFGRALALNKPRKGGTAE